MRELNTFELEQTMGAIGMGREIFQSISNVGAMIASGTMYLALSNDYGLSFYTRAAIGMVGGSITSGLVLLGLIVNSK